ncbi:MAG: DUF3592 domain-containing protein [Planctomycetota bacterium]
MEKENGMGVDSSEKEYGTGKENEKEKGTGCAGIPPKKTPMFTVQPAKRLEKCLLTPVAAAFAFGLVILLTVSTRRAYQATRLILFGRVAIGEVVGVRKSGEGRSSRPLLLPLVKFDAEGEEFSFQEESGVWSAPKVGSSVSVIYEPRNPQSASIYSFWYLCSGALFGFAVLILFSFGFYVIMRRIASSGKGEATPKNMV